MVGGDDEHAIDFEHPPKLFLMEDRLKAVLGGPLLFNRFFRRQGGFQGTERVLDFGCGGGVSTRCIAKQLSGGGEVTGVDISSLMTARAKRRLRKYANAQIMTGELPTLSIEDASFDIAIMIYVMHDIDRNKRPAVASSIAAKLKTGGVLWVLEPTKIGHGIQVAELRGLMGDAGLQEISAESRRSSYQGRFTNR